MVIMTITIMTTFGKPSVVFGSFRYRYSLALPNVVGTPTWHNVSMATVTASVAGILPTSAIRQRKSFGVLRNYCTEWSRHCGVR